MKQILNGNTRWANIALALGISVLASGLILAQDQQQAQADPGQGGWRELRPNEQADAPPPAFDPAPQPPPRTGPLTVPAGTILTVRTTQPLSSDHNQPGDGFTAVLQQPLVVDGLVVAHRGQTVLGTVTDAQKAGRAKGVSHLGLEIAQLTLVDGQQLPVKRHLLERKGNTSVGRDAAAIGVTSGGGAAVGAGVAEGVGAGVGAAAGGGLGLAGVLLTRGQPTVVYPETLLTFRVANPVTISTERSEQAFQPVTPRDYENGNQLRSRPPSMYAGPGRGYPPPPPPPYYSPYYAGGYPYYYGGPFFGYGYGWGPSFYFYSRPRVFTGGGRFYRR